MRRGKREMESIERLLVDYGLISQQSPTVVIVKVIVPLPVDTTT